MGSLPGDLGSLPQPEWKSFPETKNASFQGVRLSVARDSSVSKFSHKIGSLFHSLVPSNITLQRNFGGSIFTLYISGQGELGQSLLEQYRNARREGQTPKEAKNSVLGILLTHSEEEDPNFANIARASRIVAAPKTVGEIRKLGGLMIMRDQTKLGEDKIHLFFPLGNDDVLQAGRYSQVKKIAQVTFKAAAEGMQFQHKEAILKTPVTSNLPSENIPTAIDDIPSLKFIQSLNGGKLPEGFLKMPKAVLHENREQLTKLYPLGDLQTASRSLSPLQKFEVMEGPVKALLGLRKFGVGHGDIKRENILVGIGKNGKLFGVLADFGKVLVFPSFNISLFDNPEKAKEFAEKILKLRDSNKDPGVVSTPSTSFPNESLERQRRLKRVWDGLKIIAEGKTLNSREKFINDYNQLKAIFEKTQVFQIGIALLESLTEVNDYLEIVHFFESDYINKITYRNLKPVLANTFPNQSLLVTHLILFFTGTLDSNYATRFNIHDTVEAYERILAVARDSGIA